MKFSDRPFRERLDSVERPGLPGTSRRLGRCSFLTSVLILGSMSVTGCHDGTGESEPSTGGPTSEVAVEDVQEVSGASGWFVDVAEAAGLDFELQTRLEDRPMLPEIVAGGGAGGDFDGDGRLDVYLVQATGAGGNRLFRNLGDLRFEDVSDTSGSSDGDRFGMAAATGDFDGDGDLDLYVSNLGRDTLLRNDGDFRFVDVTDESGLGDLGLSASATFFDGDGDGDLDLFVTRYVDWSASTDRYELSDTSRSAAEPPTCVPVCTAAPITLRRSD